MQMHPALQIQSMMKALTDVVLPAVDPANKLAQEQVRLVLGTLGLMAQQLPLRFQFNCDELARLLKLAGMLQGLAWGGPQTTACINEMTQAAATTNWMLERSKLSPEGIEQAVRSMLSTISQVVRSMYVDGDDAALKNVEAPCSLVPGATPARSLVGAHAGLGAGFRCCTEDPGSARSLSVAVVRWRMADVVPRVSDLIGRPWNQPVGLVLIYLYGTIL